VYFHLYTNAAKRVLGRAMRAAIGLSANEIKSTHLLLGWLHDGKGFLASRRLTKKKLRVIHEACGGRRLKPSPTGSQFLMFNEESRAILFRAAQEMLNRRSQMVDLEHLLLGFLYVPGEAKDLLNQQGLAYARISAAVPFQPREMPSASDALDYT
jgi:ATP-dependent Clp protease ATP-binding subunit ClpA